MSLTGVIASFAAGQSGGIYTLTRTTNGSWTDGVFVPGSTSTVQLQAVEVPMSGRDLRALPEGLGSDAVKLLYTLTEVYGARDAATPDTISIRGEPWMVHQVQRWQAFGEVFYRVLVARRKVP